MACYYTRPGFKKLLGFLIQISVSLANGEPAGLSPDANIHLRLSLLESRLVNASLVGTPLRDEMFQIIKTGNNQQGAWVQAGLRLVTHPNFPRHTLRDFFASMQNLAMEARGVPFNRPIALMIKYAMINKDIRPIFTANETYQIRVGAALTEANNVTDANLENADLTQPASFNRVAGQVARVNNVNGQLPAKDAAGFMTLSGPGSFAENVFTGGTNRRVIQYLFNFFGEDRNQNGMRSTAYPTNFIAQDVTRTPNEDPNKFSTFCATCHGFSDAAYGAVCYHFTNYTNGAIDYTTNPANPALTKCVGSAPPTTTREPNAHRWTTDEWNIVFTSEQRALLGDGNAASQGRGFNGLVNYWSNILQVYRFFILWIMNGPKGVCPSALFDDPKLDKFASDLQSNGDLVKKFVEVAVDPVCLGP